MTEEAAKKSKSPKSKKSGPDKATKEETSFSHKVRKIQKHLDRTIKKNLKRRKAGKEELNTDKQAETALGKLEKKGSATPRRTPNSEKWTHVTKDLAQLHRLCGYKGNGVLRFGQPGVGIFDGMKPSTKRWYESSVKKYLTKLRQASELKNAELQKQKEERLAKEATQKRRTEEERKKLKGKTAKKPTSKATKVGEKPAVRPAKKKQ